LRFVTCGVLLGEYLGQTWIWGVLLVAARPAATGKEKSLDWLFSRMDGVALTRARKGRKMGMHAFPGQDTVLFRFLVFDYLQKESCGNSSL
jgi:hypothetical protein